MDTIIVGFRKPLPQMTPLSTSLREHVAEQMFILHEATQDMDAEEIDDAHFVGIEGETPTPDDDQEIPNWKDASDEQRARFRAMVDIAYAAIACRSGAIPVRADASL